MFKLTAPIASFPRTQGEMEELISELKRAKIEEVFLIYRPILGDLPRQKRWHDQYVKDVTHFREVGFAVSAWVCPTLMATRDKPAEYAKTYTPKISLDGVPANGTCCPMDEGFAEEFSQIVKMAASSGVDRVMFEDDYKMITGYFEGLHCWCENHRREYFKRIGREISAEELKAYLTEGGKNPYRDAWYQLRGDTLRDFTRKIARTVHAEYPDVPIGFATDNSSFFTEGVNVNELARIGAGKNRPFIRLGSAPYWATVLDQPLAPVIEAARLQTQFIDEDIDLLVEGDTYPRPRHLVPAAYVENHEMVIRADGRVNGTLWYINDYTASHAKFETGYIDERLENEPHYEELDRRFGGMETVGLNVFYKPNIYADSLFDEGSTFAQAYGHRSPLLLESSWMLTDNSIPSCYGRTDCANIVFGDCAAFLDEAAMKNGVVLDAHAAKILQSRGIDVGIESMELAPKAAFEHYDAFDDQHWVRNVDGKFYRFVLKQGAKVLSRFLTENAQFAPMEHGEGYEPDSYPACYLYENADGYRFMVYSFVGCSVLHVTGTVGNRGVFRSYYRQRQLAEGIKYLQGRPLPAMCFGHPELYTLCKKNDTSMSVGLWNLHPDTVRKAEIELDGEYSSVDFYNCEGELCGNHVKLKTNILPQQFAFFTVHK